MIQLIRVYRDDQIQPVHVEAFDRNEPFPHPEHERKDCRCLPKWGDYYEELARKYGLGRKITGAYFQKYEFGRVDMEWIYPTPQKGKDNV